MIRVALMRLGGLIRSFSTVGAHKGECTASERVRGTPKPDAVLKYAQPALATLASQWKVQFEKYQEDAGGQSFIPPVMIVVCDNTDTAQIVYEHIAGKLK